MSTSIRNICGLAAAAILFGVGATAAAAIRTPNLHVSSTGEIRDLSVGNAGWASQRQDSVTGPIQANIERGAVFAYRSPGFPDWELETTLFGAATTYADYGTNRAAIELNLRPVIGDDRGAYPAGNFSGSLGQTNVVTESGWTDTFVIEGGTGVGTATVSVALRGDAQSRYGCCGTGWYDAEPSFELFGTSGFGFATYNLIIHYDVLPPGFDNEGSFSAFPIQRQYYWGETFLDSEPLPAFIISIGVQPEILTGSILFEYGVPFSLSSFLYLNGSNQINIDFDHTATLSLFDLPEGASLTSGSGHIYPVSSIPEPSTSMITICGFVLVTVVHGLRRGRQRRDTKTGDDNDILSTGGHKKPTGWRTLRGNAMTI